MAYRSRASCACRPCGRKHFEKTAAHDQAWMHSFYGVFLSQLFGYDEIYVLSGDNAPVYAFADGHDVPLAEYGEVGAKITDLVAAVRNPDSEPKYDVVTTDVSLGGGQSVHHRALSDIRNILNHPATVVVSTIIPDRRTPLSTHRDILWWRWRTSTLRSPRGSAPTSPSVT
jgi:hypothetical protein